MTFNDDPFSFISRRSPVLSQHGMVASSQPLATQAGISILREGGNAVDAAVAVAAALNVTEPCSTGIGGDCFMLFFEATSGKVYAMNGSGRAPSALTVEKVLEDIPSARETGEMVTTHPHTATVPGAAAGWVDAVEQFGSLPLEKVLKPAITLAEEGFPVSPVTAHYWERGVANLKAGPYGEEMLINGRAPSAGEIFKNPTLGRTFRELAEKGKSGFYEGRIAQEIVSVLRGLGGVMTLEDLKNHKTTFPDPISVNYHGVDVYEHPPNGQGITALLALNILKGLLPESQQSRLEHNGTEYLHTLIESLRIAFADAKWYVTDPDVLHVPVKELLSEDYTRSRRALFDPKKAAQDPVKGSPFASSSTVSFQVVDKAGNAVSFINSNYMGFGTGIIPKECGFTIQNRGHNFSLQKDHPNVLAPNKRPYHTIIPGMALKNGKLFASFSVMGGFMQPQGHVQVLLNMIDYGANPQTALDKPRFCIGATYSGKPTAIEIEEGISDEVITELKAMGHEVKKTTGWERSIFGRGQIIYKDPKTGVLWAGSDGRADGCAIGL